MLPHVCIVGRSGSGKTTLILELIPEFKKRGYRLATVKHTHHEVDMDIQGKDTWRYAQAGSDAVVISSANNVAYIEKADHDYSLEETLQLITGDFDFVLVEGFKWSNAPKIAVHRDGLVDGLICKSEDLIAIASDEVLDTPYPQRLLSDVTGIADLIEANIKSQRSV
ncbi:MAG: molybdopterin-guanine dinucleotide biosynthesis protein B [Chloroflexi bacterium]|jgi:molybdopterin-guanine dinucleotide biosynthesis protein MobB|nr:molybdopterin-guanine dinucleotide biosynthesis protein B [Chloroflexota bacterium]MBT7080460.1 molybdopterin-guanine dinucleotide biosynthesis protein B [Chloroflexota bacterium]MBT7289163.1 molybdopterin-guanine dinucleotide biosynthesis protein B [Chloroflexota bacterium]